MASKLVIGSIAAAVVLAGGFVWFAMPNAGTGMMPITSSMHSGADNAAGPSADDIIVPEFSQIAQSGEVAFNENCAACHGINLVGSEIGPPLIHALYRPGHHSDNSIYSAAFNGVRAHHWDFGNMPPVEGITEAKVRWIIKYIREIQVVNGIM